MFMAMAGLAIDGALLLAARRELQSVVDGAARAGATRLDMDLLRASGGTDVQLDRAARRAASLSYLDQSLAADSELADARRWRMSVASHARPRAWSRAGCAPRFCASLA